jgi:hypothetical protein
MSTAARAEHVARTIRDIAPGSHARLDHDHVARIGSPARRAALRALAGGAAAALVAGRVAAQAQIPAAADQTTSLLLVQSFGAGTFAADPGTAGLYTLALAHSPSWTLYFDDRPQRAAGILPTMDLASALAQSPDDPPNAALVARRAGDPAGTAASIWIVTLVTGTYEAGADALSYTARVVNAEDAGAAGFTAPSAPAPTTPLDLGAGHLFIDSYTLRAFNNTRVAQKFDYFQHIYH